MVIQGESRVTNEAWVVPADDPTAAPRSVGGRRQGVRYEVEHAPGPAGDRLLVVTDDGAVEFRLMSAPVPRDADQDHTVWTQVRPEAPAERLYRADAFAGGVVLSFRAEGEHRLRVVGHDDLAGEGHVLRTSYDVGCLDLSENALYDVDSVLVVRRVLPPAAGLVVARPAPPAPVRRCTAQRRRATTPSATSWSGVPSPLPTARLSPRCCCGAARHALDGTAPALSTPTAPTRRSTSPSGTPALPTLLDRGVVWVHALDPRWR